tara:strand:- start:20 stop:535 length:516 start_codon:yes stop_codon:yes gene_type:complete
MIPKEYTSTLWVIGVERNASGAKKGYEPPNTVSKPAPVRDLVLDNPKSVNLAMKVGCGEEAEADDEDDEDEEEVGPLDMAVVNNTLAGFKSRCTTNLACKYATAEMTCSAKINRCLTFKAHATFGVVDFLLVAFRLRIGCSKSFKVPASQYSITKNGDSLFKLMATTDTID